MHNKTQGVTRIFQFQLSWEGLSVFVYHKNSQRPPVCTLRVSSPVDHLGGHILHRTTEGISLLISIYWLFTQAKVCMTARESKKVGIEADQTVASKCYSIKVHKRKLRVAAEKSQGLDLFWINIYLIWHHLNLIYHHPLKLQFSSI